jgi:uncharacterized surface protein with fasciclin (FAS1) repeats
MNRILRISSGFLLLLLFLTGCVKKEFESYYARPDNLAQPIYQQLEARTNFTSLLACIDKAKYKNILSTAGYWTFFAPNDAAFQKYFTDNGISGISAIDSTTARKIVTYSLVYNAFRKDQLSNYQSSSGVIPNLAFKRKTVYYDFVQTESGSGRKIVATNTDFGIYLDGDNNNKNIPYFTDNFLTAKGLSASDYNYFFPNTPYTGFNVLDASVVNADIIAENGIVHEIDKVVLPQLSLDQYLSSNPDYSEFKALLDKMVFYSPNADLTHRYNVLTGSTDSVYIKRYNPLLGLAPNNENYLFTSTASQINGYTLMIPTNRELLTYTKKLLTYYGSFDAAPPVVLSDFLNAHMWLSNVWPNRVSSTANVQNENPTFSAGNIVDKKLLSNGIFYGTNKVQDANVFRTVYSKAYLDPRYLLMTRGLNAELKYSIINPNVKYTLFMMPDVSIRAGGYDYDAARENNNTPWSYASPGPPVGTRSYGALPRDNFYRILQTSVLQPNVNLENISGEGIVETYNGEYLKYKNNTIVASGNVDAGNYLVKDSSQTVINGTVYYTHEVVPAGKLSAGGLLTFTEKGIGFHLNALAVSDPTNFASFNSYLINSKLWDAANLSIIGISNGTFYTLFIPNNAAIVNAVKQGILPGTIATGVPNFKPASGSSDEEKVNRFIYYHILNKNTVVPDGVKNGAYATLLQNSAGDPTYITVINQLNNMELRDMYNNSAKVILPSSNNLSNRTVIHSIDNYLKYNY